MEQAMNHIRPGRKSFLHDISEDIWAVIIGGLLIVIILSAAFFINDLKFTTPVYEWVNVDELFSKVLTGSNILLLIFIAILFLILSSIAIGASGNRIGNYVRGFAIIFFLAI